MSDSLPPYTSTASGVAIGVFDGVHRGHQDVIAGLVQECRSNGLECGVLTFDPHPVAVLAPGREPPLLTTVARRLELLKDLGVDWVGRLDLGRIRTMSPDEFVRSELAARAACRIVSVGDDFRFGLDRAGDVESLRELGSQHGFSVRPVELVEDEGDVISSTRIREDIIAGRVSEAARLLGRPHRLTGPVIHGEALGRTLGFPTANLRPPVGMAIPDDGIYAARVSGPAPVGVGIDAVVSIGRRPTFEEEGQRLVEAHVFDFDADIYGVEIGLDFVARLRGEKRFESAGALVEQMEADAALARAVLA